MLAGAGGFEPPHGGIKICQTRLILLPFSPDCGKQCSRWINGLPAISRLSTKGFRIPQSSEFIRNRRESAHLVGDGVAASNLATPTSFLEIATVKGPDRGTKLRVSTIPNDWRIPIVRGLRHPQYPPAPRRGQCQAGLVERAEAAVLVGAGS